MSFNKAFSRELFNANDNIAKHAGFAHLAHMGADWVSINKNDYGCDLVYRMKGDCEEAPPRLLEVEVKRTWKGGTFPFPTINVLFRKQKYFIEGADLLLLAGDLQHYLVLSADNILDQTPEEVSNKYVYGMEFFYQVPEGLATYYKLAAPLTNTSPACYCGNRSFWIAHGQLVCEGCNKCQ